MGRRGLHEQLDRNVKLLLRLIIVGLSPQGNDKRCNKENGPLDEKENRNVHAQHVGHIRLHVGRQNVSLEGPNVSGEKSSRQNEEEQDTSQFQLVLLCFGHVVVFCVKEKR